MRGTSNMDYNLDAAAYFFHQGTNYRAYEYMGAHQTDYGGRVFRIWAPNATYVALVGDFCGWDAGIPMERITKGGIWQCTVGGGSWSFGDKYKYKITGSDGVSRYKTDPYAVFAESLPNGASIIYDESSYNWRDDGFMAYRRAKTGRMDREPLNIYRLSPTRWNGCVGGWSALARELAPYVKQMGFTHIELEEITEISLLYATTVSMGTPQEFMSFVDSMHEAGVGVIIDRQMAGGFEEEYGIRLLDGQPLYEKSDCGPRFAFGRNEVECFLISNAHYWFERFHIDGLRLCGVEPALSLETVGFFRKLNAHIKADFPDALVMCDRIADRNNVTNFKNGGLGFDFKLSPYPDIEGEKYVLSSPPPSSDSSIARAELGYFMTRQGKKLCEMGTEIGEMTSGAIDWSVLGLEDRAKFQLYLAELGQFYLSTPAMWQNESDSEGRIHGDPQKEIVYFIRTEKDGEEIVVLVNLTSDVNEKYRVGVPTGGTYREIFNSDAPRYGGSGYLNSEDIKSQIRPWKGQENSIVVRIAPKSVAVLKRISRSSTPSKTNSATQTVKKNITIK